MFTCPVYQHTGITCPGCGIQRSFVELLKGNFVDSFIYYPALIPLILMLLFLVLHLLFKFDNGAKILKIFFVLNAIIISLNYIIKTLVIY
ncbi:MAG: DUF2752 domain-containing protein [Bacteroidales bacterium]|nr:DUF2752 domain-containing protein [Bacteroidales bacterium]